MKRCVRCFDLVTQGGGEGAQAGATDDPDVRFLQVQSGSNEARTSRVAAYYYELESAMCGEGGDTRWSEVVACAS
jgi:hypothetical protein